jgi:hypothetical protein
LEELEEEVLEEEVLEEEVLGEENIDVELHLFARPTQGNL